MIDALIMLAVGIAGISALFYIAKNMDKAVFVVSDNMNPRNNYTVYERKDGTRYTVYKYGNPNKKD